MNTESKGLTQKAVQGMVWLLASSGARTGLTVVVVAILARLLNPHDFGLIAVANVVIGFADIFSYFGIGAALVQSRSIEQRHVATGFSSCILLSLAVACLIYILSPFIARFFQMEELTGLLRVLSIVFPLNAVSAICSSILQREFKYRRLASAEVFAYLFGYGSAGILLASLGFGVWALVGATLGLSVFRAVILFVLQPYSLKLKVDRGAFKELVSFGSGFTVANAFNFAASSGDNLVVGRLLGAGALGIYSRAYSMMDMTNNILSNALNSVFFPAVSRVQNEQERLAKALQRGITLTGKVFLPACVVSIILAPELVSVLLGPKWTGVVLPFRILAAGMYFRLGYMVAELLSRGSGRIYSNAWRQGLYAFLVIVGASIGCQWGIKGVSISISLVLGLNFLAMIQLDLSITGLSFGQLYQGITQLCILTAIFGLEVFGAAEICREFQLNPILIIFLCMALVLASLLVMLRFGTKIVLGKDDEWVLEEIGRYFPLQMIFGESVSARKE
jgi:O-antigen/teichoic acid export membrane protein